MSLDIVYVAGWFLRGPFCLNLPYSKLSKKTLNKLDKNSFVKWYQWNQFLFCLTSNLKKILKILTSDSMSKSSSFS